MCSSVDLPAPLGPTRATSSPGRIASVMPRRISSLSPPWAKCRQTWSSFRSGSLIAQRLHRIEARRAPGRIDRRGKGQAERHAGHDDHFQIVDPRGKLAQEVDLGVEEGRARQALEPLPDDLDILCEGDAESEARDGPDDADRSPGQEEHQNDGPPRGAHGAEERVIAATVLN